MWGMRLRRAVPGISAEGTARPVPLTRASALLALPRQSAPSSPANAQSAYRISSVRRRQMTRAQLRRKCSPSVRKPATTRTWRRFAT
jgi:hypothetical protein